MDFGTPGLMDVWLKPPDNILTGSFLELELHCLPAEIPVTMLQVGQQSCESSGGHACGLQESEPEDFPKLFIDHNEVYCSEASSGSDSGNSEDAGHPGSPLVPKASSSPALHEVYEAGAREKMQEEDAAAVEVIFIQLGQNVLWKGDNGPSHRVLAVGLRQFPQSVPLPRPCASRVYLPFPFSQPPMFSSAQRSPPFMMPDACMVSELPLAHSHILPRASYVNPVLPAILLLCQTLFLTNEKCLLGQERLSLPSHLPLTKGEKRVLKVSRKIRNKQSAQDSLQRKKEYIDGLESWVAACSAQNELQKKVQEFERYIISLMTQLRQQQMLITQTSNKAAQTSTCVLILLFRALMILPRFSPFQGLPEAGSEEYQPHGVISKNILTHKDITENSETPKVESRLRGPPGAKSANDSTRTLLEEMGGKTGPRGHIRTVLHADEM
ncbi:LOW QUALITY PROTEIN: cyclic AMP-responsive element-binding protein 3-like protein 4 [Rhynchonycteris naso]